MRGRKIGKNREYNKQEVGDKVGNIERKKVSMDRKQGKERRHKI